MQKRLKSRVTETILVCTIEDFSQVKYSLPRTVEPSFDLIGPFLFF